MPRVENTLPVLPVADIERSLKISPEVLGWKVAWCRDDLPSGGKVPAH